MPSDIIQFKPKWHKRFLQIINKMKGLLIVAAVFLTFVHTEKIIYFHHGETQYPNDFNLEGIQNNPKYVTMDCSKFDCTKFVKTNYPAMFYWKGAGSAFEKIMPHTQDAIRNHFAGKKTGLVNRFRFWIEELTLFETFIYASIFAYFLFTVFTFLFSPKEHKKAHHQKKNK